MPKRKAQVLFLLGNRHAVGGGDKIAVVSTYQGPKSEWVVVGRRLREVESAEGLDGRRIAEALGITEVNWSRYKSGTRELPIPVAGELRRRYGCALDWLYLGEEYHNAEAFKQRLAESRRKAGRAQTRASSSRDRTSKGDGPSRA